MVCVDDVQEMFDKQPYLNLLQNSQVSTLYTGGIYILGECPVCHEIYISVVVVRKNRIDFVDFLDCCNVCS